MLDRLSPPTCSSSCDSLTGSRWEAGGSSRRRRDVVRAVTLDHVVEAGSTTPHAESG